MNPPSTPSLEPSLMRTELVSTQLDLNLNLHLDFRWGLMISLSFPPSLSLPLPLSLPSPSPSSSLNCPTYNLDPVFLSFFLPSFLYIFLPLSLSPPCSFFLPSFLPSFLSFALLYSALSIISIPSLILREGGEENTNTLRCIFLPSMYVFWLELVGEVHTYTGSGTS